VDGSLQCVHPCPSFVYQDSEYHDQYLAYIIPGLVSCCCNGILVAAIIAMDRKERENVPLSVQALFAMGFLGASF
jgi:hypothetical protein